MTPPHPTGAAAPADSIPAGEAGFDPSSPDPPVSRRALAGLALAFAGAIVAAVLAYLAFAVPGAWFPSAKSVAFGVRDLKVTRGAANVVGNELVVEATDPSGLAVVSVSTDLRSSDYAAVSWIGIDFPDDVQVSLLWYSDYARGAINSAPVKVESGRPQPVLLVDEPKWIGPIKGLAIAIRGTLRQPVVLRGVVVKPMGATEVLRDRVREWFAFEPWTGTSINTITGGADLQALPLPLLLAAAVALSVGLIALLRRHRPAWVRIDAALALVAIFLAAWWILDARWTVNLARQAKQTTERYAGRSWEDKRLANDDGPLFAFVQKALAAMPPAPVRVFVVADAHYFRGRAAYHLYPHSVWYDPRSNTAPPAEALKPGDWLLVYQRRGIQYDPVQKRLRWDGGQTKDAELRLAGQGAALFEIR